VGRSAGVRASRPEPGATDRPLAQPISRERLVAVSRLTLIATAVLVLWLDPASPSVLPPGVVALVPFYAVWALLVAWLAWRIPRMPAPTPLILHCTDIGVLASLTLLTQAWTDGPYLLSLIFLLTVALIRWHGIGVRWTALALLSLLVVNAGFAAIVAEAPPDYGTLAVHGVYLGIVTLLLSYFTAYEERLLARLTGLAPRANAAPSDMRTRLGVLLAHVARQLDASRVVLAWTETGADADADTGSIAEWTQGTLQIRGASADDLASLAPPDAGQAAFLAAPVASGKGGFRMVSATATRLRAEDPLPRWVRAAGAACTALSIPVRGASMSGRLFVLEPEAATTDELVLGELLGREIVTYMDQLAYFERVRRSGVAEERIRLARDLHDGVIQSLAAAAMRLEAARHLLKRDVPGAEKAIREIQDLLTGEQQEMRDIIATLQPDRAPRHNAGPSLGQRLESMGIGLARHWRLTVETDNRVPDTALSPAFVREVAWIVREALVNAARHGQARHASVHLALVDGLLHLRVADDGCGFPFRGRMAATKLAELNQGPFNLAQRVKALGGKLVIDSRDAGATLEMSMPIRAPRTSP
jgi:signal transduction histidine kinase